jgi:multidrug resistance protein MdtO
MAPPATELPATEWGRRVAGLLAPTPGRGTFALRQAATCALVLLVAQIYQAPEAALTVYIVFFLNKPDRVESILLNIVFTVLITLVVAMLLGLSLVVLDWPLGRVAAIALVSVALLFLGSASKLRPVGGTVALIVGYGLDELGGLQVGELAVRALLYVWGFVAIPAAVSLVVNFLAAPSPRRLLLGELARRVRLCAAAVDGNTGEAFAECRDAGSGELEGWLKRAAMEHSVSAADVGALRGAIGSTTELILLAETAVTRPESLTEAERAVVVPTLREMAAILERGAWPLGVLEGREMPRPATWLGAAFARTLSGYADPAAALPPAPKTGFFLPDAFTNPQHVQYALKATGAAVFCYVLYELLDWPGIHTCFITCYIVGLGTAAESIEKLTLRILGCLIGAAAGYAAILLVLPDLTSIGALMAVVFIGALAAAWVAAGSARISYAGFQIGLAFFLCVVQGASPAFDLTAARDRVIGILLGNLVTFLVFTMIWPVSLTRRMDPGFAALLRGLASMQRAATWPARRALAGRLLGQRSALAEDLSLVDYEPDRLRPGAAWLGRRRAAAGRLRGLVPALFLADATLAEAAATRLDGIAGRLEGHAGGMERAADPAALLVELDRLEGELVDPPADRRMGSLATA